jgi:hypothetical protein
MSTCSLVWKPDTAGDKSPWEIYTKKIDLDGGLNDVLDSLADIEGTWASHAKPRSRAPKKFTVFERLQDDNVQ